MPPKSPEKPTLAKAVVRMRGALTLRSQASARPRPAPVDRRAGRPGGRGILRLHAVDAG